MSFNDEIKEELVNKEWKKDELLPLLCGFACQTKPNKKTVVLKSQKESIMRLISNCFKKLYKKDYEVLGTTHNRFTKETTYTITIPINEYQKTIQNKLHHLDQYMVPEKFRIFLSGIFLSSGYISDPQTQQYSLYIKFNDDKLPLMIMDTFSSYEDERRIVFRMSNNNNSYKLYIKKGEHIANFIAFINAPVSMLNFENIRIIKDFYNNTNRMAICDSVNYNKSLATGQKNLKDIEIIKNKIGLSIFDEKTKLIISIREENFDSPYSEIAEIATKKGCPISKSSVSKVFSNLAEIAKKYS